MNEIDLQKLRQEIDGLNRQLVQMLSQRLDRVLQVAAYKEAHRLPVLDAAREKAILEKVQAMAERPEYRPAIVKIMEEIMHQSRELEIRQQIQHLQKQESEADPVRVGYQGVNGSYSHQALEEYFQGRAVVELNYTHFEDVVEAVQNGGIKYGILPIENSSTGGITEVYDLVRRYDCQIVGEHYLRVEQDLLALPGASLAGIKDVYSHPQGFEQSRAFFKQHPHMTFKPYFNTALSAKMVSESGDLTKAAVASSQAARLYHLQILAAGINSNLANYTRFIIIAKEEERRVDADKITVVLAVKHEPGSLYKILGTFYQCGLNLVNLESRPIIGKSWEYFFHIDLTGNLMEPAVREAMSSLAAKCTYCKILGNYRSGQKK